MAATAFTVPPVQPGATPVVVGSDDASRNRYKSTIYKLGIVEIVLGCIFCALCIISIGVASAQMRYGGYYYYAPGLSFVSPGIWCGIFAIISGGLAVCTRNNPSVCMYNANMAMSIISAIFMGMLFIMSVIFALFVGTAALITFQSMTAVGSLAAMIVSIVHSAYCCAGVCCRKNASGAVTYTTTRTVTNQQYVQLPNGQFALLQTQPFLGTGYQATSIPNTGMPVTVHPQPMPLAHPTTTTQYAPPQPAGYPQPDPYKQQGTTQQFPPQQQLLANPPAYDAQSHPATNQHFT